MSSRRHACNCDECVTSRNAKKELQFGGTDWEADYDSPAPRRKKSKAKRNVCAKSKTGEPCDDKGTMVKGTKPQYDLIAREYVGNTPNLVRCCSRCGRQRKWGWGRYY